ncbi:MAG: FAD-dependent oxidoreductase [Deltaproteobacteria bacterium]|nr:FAD-dependent oxidoreductase [Deltaproteobacteria bacterium]
MKLFEPCKIGTIELKNRLVLAPMSNNMTDNGFVTEEAIHFYKARAEGGVGLITVEDGIVDYPLANNVKSPVAISDDKYIPMLKKLNDTIHQYDVKTVMQLAHAGRRAGRVAKSGCLEVTRGKIPVAPSALAHPVSGYVVPHELSRDEIREIIEQFGQGARRAVKAGFDFIALHCAHMYLCGEFLSPWANKRKDEYGRGLKGRLRFVLEVIERIRAEAGEDHPIIVRINGQEPRGGNSLADIRRIAQALEKAGVDAIHVSVGFAATIKDPEFIPSIPSMRFPDGPIIHLAKNVKDGVSIPVIAVNKIRDARFAEQILQEGKADLIAMGRTLVADPEFPKKSKEGRYDDVRPCISCCQGCINRVLADLPMKCTVNPLVGREGEKIIEPADPPRKVMIVGGGPAGLETALISAQRGNTVVLYEQSGSLGGQMKDAALLPFKKEIKKFTDYLIRQVTKAGVAITLNTVVTNEIIKKVRPDILIMAVGAQPIIPEIPGVNNGNVVKAQDVLRETVDVGNRVLIIGGGELGLETGEFLGLKGKKVTIVEMTSTVGATMPSQTRMPLMFNLENHKVKILTLATPVSINDKGVVIEQLGKKKLIPADTVVIAAGYRPPDRSDIQSLTKDAASVIIMLGNCGSVGDIMNAVENGFNFAASI